MKQEEQAYTLDDLLNKASTYIKNDDEINRLTQKNLQNLDKLLANKN